MITVFQAVKGGSPAVLKKIIDGCSNPQGSLRVAFEVFVNLALKKAAKMGDDAMVTELLPSDISHQLDLKRNPKPDIILDTEKRHETALSLAVDFWTLCCRIETFSLCPGALL